MAERVRSFDWSSTPLGSIESWAPELKTAAAFVLENRFPAALVWGADLTTLYNDAFRPILGAKPDALGLSFRKIWQEAWSDLAPIVEKAFAGQSTFIEDYPLQIDRSGTTELAYFTFSYSPVRDAHGVICGMIDLVIETTARVVAEARTQSLASIVEYSNDAIITKDLEGILTSWNLGAERIFGYTAEEVIGKSVTILIPPDRVHEEPVILDRIRRGELIEHYETIRRRKDGQLISMSLTVSPVRNTKNEIIGASKIARDITERTRSEKLVTALAREAEHRTKNVLATALATVRLSSAETAAELKNAIEGRLRALSDVHTLFVQSRWSGADLRELISQEMSPYSSEGDRRAVVTGPNKIVAPEMAQALAVTIHELATNAAKYGGLSVSDGRVEVVWAVTDGRAIEIRWTESGGPLVQEPSRKGFGTRVMKSMITGLQGDVRLVWKPEGLICEITLPLNG